MKTQLDRYINDIKNSHKYTQAEVKQLIINKEYDKVVKNSLPLVLSVAKSFNCEHIALTLDDLISIGNEALLKSLGKYKPNNPTGASFATYSTTVLRNSIIEGIANESNTIRIPKTVSASSKEYGYTVGVRDINELPNSVTQEEVKLPLEHTSAFTLLEKILKPEYINILKLKYIKGMNNREIAKIYGQSHQNIKQKIDMIMRKINSDKDILEIFIERLY
jgi:RNA polymerase sigma factor (sigma-70 family)